MVYAELDELINDLLPETKTQKEREALGRVLEASSRTVEKITKRPVGYFAAAESLPSPRDFVGEGTNYLRLPVHVENSIDTTGGVSVGGHTIKTWVELNGWLYMTCGARRLDGKWERGVVYTVRARWGWEQVPADVREACKMLAAHLWERGRGTIGQMTPNGFVIERDAPPAVKMMLAPYKRKEFEVV